MALAVTVRYDFLDNKGKTSFTKIRVPSTFSLSQYAEFGTAMAQFIADISMCKITGGSLTFAVDLSGLGLAVTASIVADIAEKAVFLFNTAITGIKAKLRLPTYDEFLVSPGTDAVDIGHIDVAAFIAAMENGIAVSGPATIQPTDDRTNDISTLTEAREVKRRTLT